MDIYVVYRAVIDYQNGGVKQNISIYKTEESAIKDARNCHDEWCAYPIIDHDCKNCEIKICSKCIDLKMEIKELERCYDCKYILCSEHQCKLLCDRHHDDISYLYVDKERLNLDDQCMYSSLVKTHVVDIYNSKCQNTKN